MSAGEAELIVLYPPGASRAAADEFIGRCLIYGFDLHIEPDDRLPAALPEGVRGVRAIVYDDTTDPGPESRLAAYREAGARVYMLNASLDITQPNARGHWAVGHWPDMLAMDANLTLSHPRFRAKMIARDDDALFDRLGDALMKNVDTRWYDATRYQWEGLLDGCELTGQAAYLDAVRSQVDAALQTPNRLDNCDTVAPILPMIRLYEMLGEERLLQVCREMADAYMERTPRYRGCWTAFETLPNYARAETIWQVCPSLMALYRATREETYLAAVLEQYENLSALLADEDSGLWRHGVSDRHRSAADWSRGAAFVLLGLIHIVEDVPDASLQRTTMLETIRRMAEQIRALQHESGFWYTVIDQPDSQFESSGTAWFGAAFERGMRRGSLDDGYRESADRAWDAVKTRIWQGRFPGHNTATTTSPVRSYYVKSHLSPTGWSHFAFRLACERRRAGRH